MSLDNRKRMCAFMHIVGRWGGGFYGLYDFRLWCLTSKSASLSIILEIKTFFCPPQVIC